MGNTASKSLAHGAANLTETNALKPYKIWDVHTHLFGFAGSTIEEKVDDCLRFADRMGVERMLVLNSALHSDIRRAAKNCAPVTT